MLEHNLSGTINLLEYCKRHQAGFTLLSTSRVYAIEPLSKLQVEVNNDAYQPLASQQLPFGVSTNGVSEEFSTSAPVSLYGATKLASEVLALEFGATFQFPVWINRCGVLAGAGQFGRPDQGIFSFWINSWLQQRPLKYIGFGGSGHLVRDCLHPRDLIPVLSAQFNEPLESDKPRVINLSGGADNACSPNTRIKSNFNMHKHATIARHDKFAKTGNHTSRFEYLTDKQRRYCMPTNLLHYRILPALILTILWLAPIAGADTACCKNQSVATATGIARAFQCMNDRSATVYYQTDSHLEAIPKVKKISAYGGVLLIRTTTGHEQILDASRVVKVTE